MREIVVPQLSIAQMSEDLVSERGARGLHAQSPGQGEVRTTVLLRRVGSMGVHGVGLGACPGVARVSVAPGR